MQHGASCQSDLTAPVPRHRPDRLAVSPSTQVSGRKPSWEADQPGSSGVLAEAHGQGLLAPHGPLAPRLIAACCIPALGQSTTGINARESAVSRCNTCPLAASLHVARSEVGAATEPCQYIAKLFLTALRWEDTPDVRKHHDGLLIVQQRVGAHNIQQRAKSGALAPDCCVWQPRRQAAQQECRRRQAHRATWAQRAQRAWGVLDGR